MATNNFLDKTGLALVWSKIKLLMTSKVDKVDGKGLSTNDYTADEKAKLANIAAGAEVNVNADWNATTGDAAILNKPTIPSATSQLTNDSGFITSADVPEGAAATTTTPKMDGTATVGTETTFARGDHIHPSDTTKVDKIDGKGLSTNDYTTAEKTKLEGIEEGANNYSLPTASSNTLGGVKIGSNLTISSGVLSANASATTPKMDGTASVGTETAFARGDHIHPSDTTKVDKVDGKGLSTNDYTTAEKNKLAAIEANANNYSLPTASASTLGGIKVGSNLTITNGVLSADAQAVDDATQSASGLMSSADKTKLDGIDASADVNVIETVKVNGTALTVTSKSVNVTVPTNNNQLTNGAGYQTASDVTSAISSAIGDLEGVTFSVVQSLPVTGDSSVIYLVADTHSDSNDSYDEYIWLSSSSTYEKIGNTDVDLSAYYNTTNLVAITDSEINTICV